MYSLTFPRDLVETLFRNKQHKPKPIMFNSQSLHQLFITILWGLYFLIIFTSNSVVLYCFEFSVCRLSSV